MHVIYHGKWPSAVQFSVITVKVFWGVKYSVSDIQFWWFTVEPRTQCVCAEPFPHVADTGFGLLEGKRVDLYELLMIRQGDIRVTGVLTRLPHGHCVEEKC